MLSKLINHYFLINMEFYNFIKFMFGKVNKIRLFCCFYIVFDYLDQNKNTTKLDSVGSYFDAIKNQSIDYLALKIPISSLKNDCKYHLNKIHFIIRIFLLV